jgi:hypothetical protein
VFFPLRTTSDEAEYPMIMTPRFTVTIMGLDNLNVGRENEKHADMITNKHAITPLEKNDTKCRG